MKRIALIAALPGELAPLVRGWTREQRGSVSLWKSRTGSAEYIAACGGMGVGAAARVLAEIERDGEVNALFSIGWVGALRETFLAGHAYTISEIIDAVSGERIPAISEAGKCVLVTARAVADHDEKRRLALNYQADLVDMESFGVATEARRRGVPFYCVRAVSDGPADRLPDFNGFIAPDGRFRLGAFILFASARPQLWPALVRLGGRSRRAAAEMATCIRPLLERAAVSSPVAGVYNATGNVRNSNTSSSVSGSAIKLERPSGTD